MLAISTVAKAMPDKWIYEPTLLHCLGLWRRRTVSDRLPQAQDWAFGSNAHMKVIRVSLSEAEPSREAITLFDDAKEELYGKLLREHSEQAEIPDLDSSATQFHIHVSATRHLGTVTTLLRRMLKHHGVAERVTIERL